MCKAVCENLQIGSAYHNSLLAWSINRYWVKVMVLIRFVLRSLSLKYHDSRLKSFSIILSFQELLFILPHPFILIPKYPLNFHYFFQRKRMASSRSCLLHQWRCELATTPSYLHHLLESLHHSACRLRDLPPCLQIKVSLVPTVKKLVL